MRRESMIKTAYYVYLKVAAYEIRAAHESRRASQSAATFMYDRVRDAIINDLSKYRAQIAMATSRDATRARACRIASHCCSQCLSRIVVCQMIDACSGSILAVNWLYVTGVNMIHLHDHAVGALAHVWQIRVARPDLECLPAHHFAIGIHARGPLACRHFDNYFATPRPAKTSKYPAGERRATTRHWRARSYRTLGAAWEMQRVGNIWLLVAPSL